MIGKAVVMRLSELYMMIVRPKSEGAAEVLDLRKWLMDVLLIFLLFIIPLSMITTIPALIAGEYYWLMVFQVVILAFLLAGIFIEGQRHNPLAWMIIIYGCILSVFIILGPHHARSGWLVMSGVIAALLFGMRAVIILTIANAFMLIGLYTVCMPGNEAWAAEANAPAMQWVLFVLNISILTLTAGLPICLLLTRLEASLQHERNARRDLSEEQHKLENAYAALQEEVEERGRIGRKLAQSEERYRTLLDNLPVGIFRTAPTGKIHSANLAFAKMFGFSSSEDMKDLLVQDSYCDLEQREEMLRKLAGEGIVRGIDFEFRRKNGERFWGAIDASKVVDAEGNFVLIDGIITDIDARRKTERALQESEKQFRDLVENAFAGIAIMVDDQAVYLNPEQQKIIGPGNPGRTLEGFKIHPEDFEKFKGYYRTVKQAGTSQVGMELRILPGGDGNGPEKWVYCRINMIQYQGRPAALITMVDTTRTRELEGIVRLKEKMASLGHVAAGIAHEIRNPLSGINVLLSGIKDNFEDPESAADIRRLIGEAEKASEKISAVIRRVLDFSRPSKPHFVPMDISIPVSEAIELARTALRKKDILFEAELADSLPVVYADGQMIEQVILNLINNAVVAVHSVEREKRIHIRVWAEDGQICLTVADSGVGVPQHQAQKIFDPFYTTRFDGSGIGLSLCQRIVSDHGGTIRVGASKWGGAEFQIKLPIEKRAHQR